MVVAVIPINAKIIRDPKKTFCERLAQQAKNPKINVAKKPKIPHIPKL
jgi:hypothetical protein